MLSASDLESVIERICRVPSPSYRLIAFLAADIISRSANFPPGSEGETIGTAADQFTDGWVSGDTDAETLINMHNRLTALESARREHSDTLAPTIEPSVSVTLWGTAAGNQNQAGIEAMKALGLGANDITLVNRTDVATADAVGTRYVFRAVSA